MAQNNVTNLWIQDANGQPQMIKVLHASHRTGTGGTKTTYRVLKTPGQDAAAINSVLSNPQVLQTLAAVRGPRTPGQRQVVAIPLANASSNSATAATGGPISGAKVDNAKTTGAAAALQLINSPLVLATTPQTPRLKTSTVSVISTPLQPPQNQNQNQNHNNNSKSQNQNQNPSQTPTPSQPQPSHASAKAAFISPILDHSGSRKRHEIEYEHGVESKRRRVDKGGKGLRHFSMKVCEKVQKKGTTSYNEVADELVAEFSDPIRCASPADQYDQKNIRRRVYDALNVLMAMNIISKEKKEIKWLGLPTNSLQEFQALEMEKQRRLEKIRSKTQQLQDLVLQQIAFKSLVQRNKKAEKQHSSPSSSSVIQLPFIVVNTSKKTVIDCSISNDKTEYLFSFDDTFEIHDDIEVLKRMGMALGLDKANCSSSDLIVAKSYVPKALEGYVDQLAKGQKEPELPEGITSTSSEFTDIERCNNGNHRPGTATPSLSTNDGFSEEEMDEEEDSDVEVN